MLEHCQNQNALQHEIEATIQTAILKTAASQCLSLNLQSLKVPSSLIATLVPR